MSGHAPSPLGEGRSESPKASEKAPHPNPLPLGEGKEGPHRNQLPVQARIRL